MNGKAEYNNRWHAFLEGWRGEEQPDCGVSAMQAYYDGLHADKIGIKKEGLKAYFEQKHSVRPA